MHFCSFIRILLQHKQIISLLLKKILSKRFSLKIILILLKNNAFWRKLITNKGWVYKCIFYRRKCKKQYHTRTCWLKFHSHSSRPQSTTSITPKPQSKTTSFNFEPVPFDPFSTPEPPTTPSSAPGL